MRRILLRLLAALARRLHRAASGTGPLRYEEDPDLVALLRPLTGLVRDHPTPYHELARRTFPAVDVEGTAVVLYDVSDQATIRWLWERHLGPALRRGSFRSPAVVDLGANDGLVGSMSLNLVQLGWHAALVEPIPDLLERARANASRYQRPGQMLHFLELALAESDGRGHLETEVGQDIARMEGHLTASPSATSLPVRLVSPETFLALPEVAGILARADLVALSLDIEGLEAVVLSRFLTRGFRPDYLIVEHLRDAGDLPALLEAHGYRHLNRIRCNDLYGLRGPA